MKIYQNFSVLKRRTMIIFYIGLIVGFSLFSAETLEESPIETFKSQRVLQGEIFFQQSQKYFSEKMYKSCIEKSLDFEILFPKHPLKLANLKLLSQAYWMDDQLEKSIQVDLKIYREFPTIEEGIVSYFEAAKKLIRIGKKLEGRKILEKIKNEMYSYKVAKDAEIELLQLKILQDETNLSTNEKIFLEEKNKALIESDK
jgi:hypothetical protein